MNSDLVNPVNCQASRFILHNVEVTSEAWCEMKLLHSPQCRAVWHCNSKAEVVVVTVPVPTGMTPFSIQQAVCCIVFDPLYLWLILKALVAAERGFTVIWNQGLLLYDTSLVGIPFVSDHQHHSS